MVILKEAYFRLLGDTAEGGGDVLPLPIRGGGGELGNNSPGGAEATVRAEALNWEITFVVPPPPFRHPLPFRPCLYWRAG